jgi:hypothetical protein
MLKWCGSTAQPELIISVLSDDNFKYVVMENIDHFILHAFIFDNCFPFFIKKSRLCLRNMKKINYYILYILLLYIVLLFIKIYTPLAVLFDCPTKLK